MNYPPQNDEIQISLFGTGFGECILIHIGYNNWIVIDSCINPQTNKPAALEYFESINISPKNAIKLIVASHFHDDHIRGLSNILEICDQADFVCSEALKCEEFFTLVYSIESSMIQSSGCNEFKKILDIFDKRYGYRNIKFALQDRELLKHKTIDQCSIFSLSPSDYTTYLSKIEFANSLPSENEPIRSIIPQSKNHMAVVIICIIGCFGILLGSDLENIDDDRLGWKCILKNSTKKDQQSQVFKVSHHGSITGHCNDVWKYLLHYKPVALLTSFIRGTKKLPAVEDIKRILSYTEIALITGNPFHLKKFKHPFPAVRKQIEETNVKIKIASNIGHIRLRYKDIKDPNNFEIKCFGSAIYLKDILNN